MAVLRRAADHRRMPWKNGRGETVEIAVFPEDAGLADFGWRVSMAAVVEDGPFSSFAGIDRTLAVLRGDGLILTIEGIGERRLTQAGAPLAFPADAPTRARLIGGRVDDLNVMTRRGAFAHRLTRGVGPQEAKADWRIALATAPQSLRLGDAAFALTPGDALVCDAADAGAPLVADDPDVFLLAEILRVGAME